jgi:hypothetical protein
LSWFRIILDEAHYIKTRSTSTAKAVFALTSLNKWCLSGTPLQNRVGELYSLVRFLRMDPHAFYFCRYARVCGFYITSLLSVLMALADASVCVSRASSPYIMPEKLARSFSSGPR